MEACEVLGVSGQSGAGGISPRSLRISAHLQIPRSQITIVDSPQLQDGMAQEWAADAVAAELDIAIKAFKPSKVGRTHKSVARWQDAARGVGAPLWIASINGCG